MPRPSPPANWITAGEWVNDHTHGQQFKTRFLRSSVPTHEGRHREISRFRDDLRASARSTPAGCAYQRGVRRTRRWRKSDSNPRVLRNTTKVSRPPDVASAWFPATRNDLREPEAIPAME